MEERKGKGYEGVLTGEVYVVALDVLIVVTLGNATQAWMPKKSGRMLQWHGWLFGSPELGLTGDLSWSSIGTPTKTPWIKNPFVSVFELLDLFIYLFEECNDYMAATCDVYGCIRDAKLPT